MPAPRSSAPARAVAFALALTPVALGLAPARAAGPVSPQLTITASTSTTVGLTVFAHANLVNGSSPTGTMTFKAFAPPDPACTTSVFTSTVAVTGTSIDSARFTTTQAGTYRWTAAYSGDAGNLAQGPTACTDPSAAVVVSPARVVLSLAAPAQAGGAIHGVVSVRGGYGPTGGVTFYLHYASPSDQFCAAPAVFTSTVPIAGAADYSSADFTPTVAGTYRWRATYTGDGNNLGVSMTACIDEAAAVVVTPAAPPGGRYAALTPARVLDTRDGTGGLAGAAQAGATVDVQVAGRGGVPASGATAVAMNVTVTQPTAWGFLTLFPAGAPRPLAANLNFKPGQTVPNLVVVKLGAAGKVALYNSAGETGVIFDVAGWYTDGGAGVDGRYTALAPARILDTRDGTGGGTRLGPGGSLDLQVTGRGGVPSSGAGAVVLNVAATGTTAASYLTVHPAGTALPLAANLNFDTGDTVSNRVMVKLGSGGRVTIYNRAGSADVVVDVSGWYTDPSVVASATGAYTALAPARVLDTRDATGGITGPVAGGTSVDVQVTGRGGVPASGVSAVILNATVTQPAGAGYLTVSPAGVARPTVADLNFAAAETRPNLVVARVGAGGKVSLFSSAGTQVIFDVAGWFS